MAPMMAPIIKISRKTTPTDIIISVYHDGVLQSKVKTWLDGSGDVTVFPVIKGITIRHWNADAQNIGCDE